MNRLYNTGETEEELKAKYNYDGSELRRAQLRMLEMIVFLDKICKDNGLEYFVVDGTLLGACRHGGFIPWDDDVDIAMSCSDIRKLSKIVNQGQYPYVIQSHKNDRGYVRHYSVLRDLNSEYIKNEFVHNQRKYRGVQIDIFPYGYSVLKSGKDLIHKLTWKNENQLLGKHPFLSLLEYTCSHYLIIPVFKLLSAIKGKKTVSLGYEACWWYDVYPYEYVFPLSSILFEGVVVPCPNEPEKVLSIEYGKYMELPSQNNRNQHQVDKIIYF